ncbi:M23 family metallopeptidase [Gaopeijia maritima]|uniref:M23 family metallopeptidase n=1 Tax=Gaopeijia maritima TaxID=3119007 RepID=UPI00326DA61B
MKTRALRRAAAACVAVVCTGCVVPRWPVEGPVTSGFGVRWRGLLPEIHRGVDIAVPDGTPITTMAPGTVRYAGTMRGYGTVVWMDHGGEVLSVYGHLQEARVVTGQQVAEGQVIGLSGRSGNVTGPHLHFEIWRWGRQSDPLPLLGGPPPPAP